MLRTGHKQERIFLQYIHKTEKDNAETLSKFWQQQENKKERIPQLKIIKTGTN
jgi:hypothetical protein